jgi:hypothetical protein
METKPNQTQSPFVRQSSLSSEATQSKPHIMQSFHSEKHGVGGGTAIMTLIFVALLGVGVGYGASVLTQQTGTSLVPSALNPNAPGKGKVYGSNADMAVFKDTADGTLKNGGIEGEGQFHLVRPGGDSQNVYLTSSTIDLSQFINQKIKVWGETQKAQKAGWLMDVGKVEVL